MPGIYRLCVRGQAVVWTYSAYPVLQSVHILLMGKTGKKKFHG